MQFTSRNESYWNNKFLAYLHDPIDKPLELRGHEERAKRIIESFGLQVPNNFKNLWTFADGIASGFERGTFPDYSEDKNKNGFIDFKEQPAVTHPIQGGVLPINKSHLQQWTSEEVLSGILDIIGRKAGDKGYSSSEIFKNNPEKFAVGRFLYTHLCLRFKLAEENVAGLGALWHKLPADTRIPDHSIWHHSALVSALVSCMNPDGEPLPEEDKLDRKYLDNIGIMVFTITPVQSFIEKARKLRDFWTGSVLLSWLAFEGIKWVIEHLGPDHVLYPSLLDQPLVVKYLETEWGVTEKFMPRMSSTSDIATFPNKAMVLVPLNYAQEIGKMVQEHISKSWNDLCKMVFEYARSKTKDTSDFLKALFDQQISSYWDIAWVATPRVNSGNVQEYRQFINGTALKEAEEQIEIFKKILDYRFEVGKYYPASNNFAQSALSNLKLSGRHVRPVQNGRKCTLCGELEALTDKPHTEGQSANEYKTNMDAFWERLRDGLGVGTESGKESGELKEDERLCAVCLVKRLLARALKDQNQKHILYETFFAHYESFPSTTEMALHDYFFRNGTTDEEKKRRIAQDLFDAPDDIPVKGIKIKNKDKYYALLLMDGDNMGKLISGNSIEATWGAVIHPEIRKRMEDPQFEMRYRIHWSKLYDQQRLVTPAIHGAISEALGDFSLYGVPSIIKKYDGRLIYAGGDDVFAIMPMETAFTAAQEIAEYYTRFYSLITDDKPKGQRELKEQEILPLTQRGKLSHGMGKGKEISISAGILICHYKEPLTSAIRDTHKLLDEFAKNATGRNACAIELRKRNGGSRFLYRKWDDEAWKSFQALLHVERSILSSSLLYSIEEYKDGILALRNNPTFCDDQHLDRFIASIIEKSLRERPDPEMVSHVRRLLAWEKSDNGEWNVSTDALKMIAFMRGESDE
jgi:CRISPR-associated protein Cmr2